VFPKRRTVNGVLRDLNCLSTVALLTDGPRPVGFLLLGDVSVHRQLHGRIPMARLHPLCGPRCGLPQGLGLGSSLTRYDVTLILPIGRDSSIPKWPRHRRRCVPPEFLTMTRLPHEPLDVGGPAWRRARRAFCRSGGKVGVVGLTGAFDWWRLAAGGRSELRASSGSAARLGGVNALGLGTARADRAGRAGR
jgi:hypothetical protein